MWLFLAFVAVFFIGLGLGERLARPPRGTVTGPAVVPTSSNFSKNKTARATLPDNDAFEDDDDIRWLPGDSGQSAAFTYVDADGIVTNRQVSNWYSDGRYSKGVCLDRKASRTFRKDRIEDWEEL